MRFMPSVPDDAVFGLVHQIISHNYGQLTKLPILQIPDAVRQHDPSFKHQPYYRMECNPFQIQIGPRVLVLTALEYPGWAKFKAEFRDLV